MNPTCLRLSRILRTQVRAAIVQRGPNDLVGAAYFVSAICTKSDSCCCCTLNAARKPCICQLDCPRKQVSQRLVRTLLHLLAFYFGCESLHRHIAVGVLTYGRPLCSLPLPPSLCEALSSPDMPPLGRSDAARHVAHLQAVRDHTRCGSFSSKRAAQPGSHQLELSVTVPPAYADSANQRGHQAAVVHPRSPASHRSATSEEAENGGRRAGQKPLLQANDAAQGNAATTCNVICPCAASPYMSIDAEDCQVSARGSKQQTSKQANQCIIGMSLWHGT